MMPTEGGAARRFVSLFGGAREHSDLVGIAKAACKEGYAVIAVKPRTKEPMCTLTDRARKAADKMAAHAARESGSKHWERVTHPCGRNHAITDPAEAERVFKRLVAAYPELNIGLEVGASRLVVVDADTEAEMASFTALLAERESNPELCNAAPTVRSPGVLRTSGEDGKEVWTHKGGGHFWYLLPEGVDFSQAKAPSLKIGISEPKASLMFRDQLVLVPPSVRDEGPYTMASDIQVAPPWMIEALHSHIAGDVLKREKGRQKALDDNDPIQVWAAGVPWDEILLRYGWTTSGRPDSCGCEVWTRPGDWSNPKSATAHEVGCTTIPITGGVLRVWTTNPPLELSGRENWSKLQVIAAYEYGGNVTDAMRGLGLMSSGADNEPTVLRSHDLTRLAAESPEGDPSMEDDHNDTVADEAEDPAADDERTSWWLQDLDPVLSGENPEPEPSILIREDGQGAFYAGKVNGLIGPSESGKSWLAMKAVAQELTAGRPVLYMDFEDTASGLVSRLRFLDVPDAVMASSACLLTYASPEEALHTVAYGDYAQLLIYRPWSLIVLDGVNAAMTLDGLDLISNKDATQFFHKVSRPATMTGACVLTIDHVTKDPENKSAGGIGAQAKRSTITGCSLRVDATEPFGRGGSGKLTLTVDKDRPGYVRGSSNAMKLWADVAVSSIGDDRLSIKLDTPAEVTKSGVTNEQAHEYRIKVINYLKGIASEVSGRKVTDEISGNASKVREALNWLVENGYVGRRVDPKNRRIHLNSYLKNYPSDGPTVIRTSVEDDPFGEFG
jgi:hypothetical protein